LAYVSEPQVTSIGEHLFSLFGFQNIEAIVLIETG